MVHAIDRATYFTRLGDDVEPGGRAPAPHPLRLVQRFVNTSNHELGESWDRLGSVERGREWLVNAGLLAHGATLGEGDRRRLIRLRTALRALAGTTSPDERTLETLEELSARAPLRVRFEDREASLAPDADGADGTIGVLIAIVYRETLTGRWARLKRCRQCEWLFFDQSKNRSSEWCSMSVCGNRVKNRAYRGRRRGPAPGDA